MHLINTMHDNDVREALYQNGKIHCSWVRGSEAKAGGGWGGGV